MNPFLSTYKYLYKYLYVERKIESIDYYLSVEPMTIHDSKLNQLHTGSKFNSKLEECYGKTSFETMW
ncbi:hypothetical protein M6B38_206220 [Iris pallida]|uniref:Uncharacterized protein n=1 Tax=Iris pallida TaxID=29817 RepID=A0AAX6E646_IRIPA|nr:hypothetical protein M6B38_206220 [Iris pallida]